MKITLYKSFVRDNAEKACSVRIIGFKGTSVSYASYGAHGTIINYIYS